MAKWTPPRVDHTAQVARPQRTRSLRQMKPVEPARVDPTQRDAVELRGPAQARREQKAQSSPLHKPSGRPPTRTLPDLQVQALAGQTAAAAKAEPPRGTKRGALAALDESREEGYYLLDESFAEGHNEEQEDPELRAAVEEAIQLLFGVRGIHHIGPGRNEHNEPVIVIAAGTGFGEASMKLVPSTIHRFATVVALPYELLPLRRSR